MKMRKLVGPLALVLVGAALGAGAQTILTPNDVVKKLESMALTIEVQGSEPWRAKVADVLRDAASDVEHNVNPSERIKQDVRKEKAKFEAKMRKIEAGR